MSRIHDALKKAEAERAQTGAGGTGHDEAKRERPETHTVGLPSLPITTPQRETAGRAGEENLLPGALEKLLSGRCPEGSWKPDTTKMLFFDGNRSAVGNEQFRTLRSRLLVLRQERPLQKILVTSPLSKEGKTFIAANLAQAFAQQAEHRVLLIDGDLRAPELHRQLGASLEPGLTNFLQGEADEFVVIQRAPLTNLFFLPAGKATSNPTELIGNGRLRTLLDRLSPMFDWILLDSPPVIPISDAKLLGEFSDGVLMVIAAAATPVEMAQKACQEFKKGQVLGAVLNRTGMRMAYSSYYGERGGSGPATPSETR